MDREPGKEILTVENLSKTVDGVKVLNNVSFRIEKGEKVAFVGENEIATTTLFQILSGRIPVIPLLSACLTACAAQ